MGGGKEGWAGGDNLDPRLLTEERERGTFSEQARKAKEKSIGRDRSSLFAPCSQCMSVIDLLRVREES